MKLLDECSPETVEEEKNNLYFFLKGDFDSKLNSKAKSLYQTLD